MRALIASVRRRPLVVQSALSPTALLDELRRSTATTGELVRGSFSFGLAPRAVAGEVAPDRVRLVALRPGFYNAWRPAFEGTVAPSASGSVISGTVGWSRFVYAFTIGWFCFAAVLGAVAVVAVVVTAVTGHLSSAAHGLAFIGACIGLMALGAALVAVASALGRRDEQYLRQWLTTVAVRSDHPVG